MTWRAVVCQSEGFRRDEDSVAKKRKRLPESNSTSQLLNWQEYFDPRVPYPTVPEIDLTGLDHPIEQVRIRRELVKAATEWGCFQLTYHGISTNLLEQMMTVSKQFFEMTDEDKREASLFEFSLGFGQSYRSIKGTKNWREVFRHEVSPITDEEIENWPKKPEAYRTMTYLYAQKIEQIANKILGLLSEGLGLTRDYILKSMGGRCFSSMLLNNYPICPGHNKAYGLPIHTDPNSLTFLLQDQVGGLEVLYDGVWLPIKCNPTAITVNVCDHLQVLSNGRYKSVEHRVVINPKETRTSIGIFVAPNHGSPMEVARGLTNEKVPALYKSTTFASYLKEYYVPDRSQVKVFEKCLNPDIHVLRARQPLIQLSMDEFSR